jgi:hypothetical protein
MATFGQGINPQLGAIDYSPILKGSVAGAEMAAKGGQMIGQGLSNLGQEVGKGIATYQLNKKIASDAIGDTEGLMQGSPAVVSWLTNPDNNTQAAKLARKLQKDGTLSVNDATSLHGAVLSFVKTDQQNKNTIIAQQQADADTLRSRAAMITAEREKVGTPGREMTPEEVAKFPPTMDITATPLPNGNLYVTKVSRFGPGSQNVINMGEDAYKKRGGTVMFDRDLSEYDAAKAAPERIQKLDEVLGLIKSGNITTGFGSEVFQNANRIRLKFLNDQKAGKTVSNTELLDSLLGSDVFPMISALGVGAKGMDTPAEREFLRESFTGTKEFNPETLKRLTEIRRDIEMRSVKQFKRDYKQGTYKRFFEESLRQPLDFSSIPPEGVTSQQWSVMTPEAKALFPESK